jgi:REP element-mobilizing transposase RayT
MSRSASQPYFSDSYKTRSVYGGSLLKGKRKLGRPVDVKRPMHLTFRAEKARGQLSFLQYDRQEEIEKTVRKFAKRNHVRIWSYGNSGNHLHLVVQPKTRDGFKRFARAVGSRVAQIVTGARKGRPFGKFWDGLFWSRVVAGGRDLARVCDYAFANQLEAEGWIPYQLRAKRKRGPP